MLASEQPVLQPLAGIFLLWMSDQDTVGSSRSALTGFDVQ